MQTRVQCRGSSAGQGVLSRGRVGPTIGTPSRGPAIARQAHHRAFPQMTADVLPVAEGGELGPSQAWSYSCHKCDYLLQRPQITPPADYQSATTAWLPGARSSTPVLREGTSRHRVFPDQDGIQLRHSDRVPEVNAHTHTGQLGTGLLSWSKNSVL